MPVLTPRRGQLVCGVAAAIVYLGTLGHQWAFDDGPIIESNPAAQTIPNAMDAFFSPYWPGDETTSGQYRPLVILSYAVDWVMSGGSPSWFHLVNLLMHTAATMLFVSVVLAWLTPLGATVAGLTFGLHPLHVEAVANVVGRAEVLVACGVLACVLAARRYRVARSNRARGLWLTVVLGTLLASLLVKEHAIIIIAVLLLDEVLDPAANLRSSTSLYVGVLSVSLAWLYLWTAIAGQFVNLAEAATIRGLHPGQRLATMFPAQLDVIRLLVWPMNLAADYNPQVIPRRTEWTWLATTGLITASSIVAIAAVSWRRTPVITFGVLFAVISYAPTSNLIFSSGITLAERNLYLAVVAPSVVLGWLVSRSLETSWRNTPAIRVGVVGVVSALLMLYTVRTVTRVPLWSDSDQVLLMDFAEHPENYRARLRLGGFYRSTGNLPAALTEAITAGAIFPEDPWVAQYSVVRALDLGVPKVALSQARKAHDTEPGHPSFARLIVRAFIALGNADSAAIVARRSIVDAPISPLAMWSYTEVLDSLRAPTWQIQMALARFDYLEGRLVSATARVDSALTNVPVQIERPHECWELMQSISYVRTLRPDGMQQVHDRLNRAPATCLAFAPDGTGPAP